MEIVLHLGAHKTASTYIQRRLVRSRGRLSEQGIELHTPRTLRDAIIAARERRFPLMPRLEARARREVIGQIVDTAASRGTKRLILSEEQFIGSLRQLVQRHTFYGDVIQQLAPVLAAIEMRPVTVLLAVRNQADFLVSAYGQLLRGWKYLPFDEDLKAAFLGMHISWADLVDDVAALLPAGSRVRVWQFEQFGQIEKHVVEQFVGTDAAPGIKPLDVRPLQGPTVESIAVLREMARRETLDSIAIRDVLDIAGKDKGFKPFDPWTRDERLLLTSRYRSDLYRLSQMEHCDWIGQPPIRAAA